MGADRKEIGWSIETHQQGFVAVEVARPITPRHAVARVRLEYTCVDDEACFRAGGAELRLLEVHDVDHGYVVPRTYATINGRHVPALDDCWAVLRPIAVDLEVARSAVPSLSRSTTWRWAACPSPWIRMTASS